MYTIYQHTTPSGKVYIGQTGRKARDRWYGGYKHNPYFQRAIDKYGWENIEHTVLLEGLTKIEADAVEKALIKLTKSYDKEFGYNLTMGVEGCTPTDGTRVRMSEGERRSWTDERKRAQSIRQTGRKMPEETKKRISEAKTGRTHRGTPCSEETRRKISEATKGRIPWNKKSQPRCIDSHTK